MTFQFLFPPLSTCSISIFHTQHVLLILFVLICSFVSFCFVCSVLSCFFFGFLFCLCARVFEIRKKLNQITTTLHLAPRVRVNPNLRSDEKNEFQHHKTFSQAATRRQWRRFDDRRFSAADLRACVFFFPDMSPSLPPLLLRFRAKRRRRGV